MMTVNQVDLRDVVGYLAAAHEQAESTYQKMASGPSSVAAVHLLKRLARREGRLARATAAFARRIPSRVGVFESMPALETAELPARRIDADVVIDRAMQIEAVIDKLLQIAMTPPMNDSLAMAELRALHHRELFGLGTDAARLREDVE